MSKGGQTTTTQTQALDPRSQGYVDQMRRAGQRGYEAISGAGSLFAGADPRSIEEQIAPFLNPYTSQVVGALGNEYDRLRGQVRPNVTSAAIQAGAYGGSRHGIAEGTRLAELDRNQMNQTASLFHQNYNQAVDRGLQYSEYQRALRERQMQDPIFRHQAATGLLNMGLGPTGGTTTDRTKQDSDMWGQILGLGLTGLSIWNPLAGAAAGAVSGSAPEWFGS